MKISLKVIVFIAFTIQSTYAQTDMGKMDYLRDVTSELRKEWPNNKTINLVFHGHSVPSGYFKTPNVNTLEAYPYVTLKNIKRVYTSAVVNVITTSIGGEQSEQGEKRFTEEVLVHRPDVLFIDYALNDRSIGLERAKIAWEKMILQAKAYGTKVILMTPTPDVKEDILSPKSELSRHSRQIRDLAKKYEIGLVDSYRLFQKIAEKEDIKIYMAQSNHINEKGHRVVADAIFDFFSEDYK
ncbi:SGNH/GDSL hydrolase family protein [Maribacter sp. MMG018]|uniref:SGNH/GDSL hydrolase family protein n=1 Tax=Maribacter sp. MMG018 TaxID=2822688 RepID=UPI001B36A58D|nr:SGNH/GDSL hydrolase family protein [Maribacter sp. MMG018]MBQ4914189.1 SGNH/GDSL hydrolase family protein [Maribacter sp. MMG018]